MTQIFSYLKCFLSFDRKKEGNLESRQCYMISYFKTERLIEIHRGELGSLGDGSVRDSTNKF